MFDDIIARMEQVLQLKRETNRSMAEALEPQPKPLDQMDVGELIDEVEALKHELA